MSNPYFEIDPITGQEEEKKNGKSNPYFEIDPAPSFTDQLKHAGGVAVRGQVGGAVKTVTGLHDLFFKAANQVAQWAGAEDKVFKDDLSAMVDRAMDEVGLPKSENNVERVFQTIHEFMGGGGMMAGIGKLAKVPMLHQNLGGQTASNIAAGTGVGVAQESGIENPLALAGIALASGSIPQMSQFALSAGVRQAIRGSDPTQMRQNIESFERAGTNPTVGQATERPGLQATENVLDNAPFGGPMRRKNETQFQEVGNRIEEVAGTQSRPMTTAEVGASVDEAITGTGGWIERTRNQANQLYDEVEQTFDTNRRIYMRETWDTVNPPRDVELHAPNLAKATGVETTAKFREALGEDLFNQYMQVGMAGLPYNVVKQIRTRIGSKIDDSVFTSDGSMAEYKRIYAAISRDMENGARRYGGEPASRAWNRASDYWKARIDRLENIQRVVDLKGGSDQIYKKLMAGTEDGAQTLQEVMESLNPTQQNILRAAVIRRMGKAIPSKQNAEGTRNSLETYLTNWNKMSPEAKTVLFANDPELMAATDAISRVAGITRDTSSKLGNVSGTARQAAAIANAGTAATVTATAALTGNAGPLLAYGLSAGLVNGISRAMTNPRVVYWLAQTSRLSAAELPAAINQLAQIAADSEDPEMQGIVEEIGKLRTP